MSEPVEDILAKPDPHIRPAEICQAFGRGKWWFRQSRVRQQLYARGFPHPISHGVWLRAAVREFIEREGCVRRPQPRQRQET